MTTGPSFSVVVTVYQREELLAHALYCLQQQTYGNYEVIVMLDGPHPVADTIVASGQARSTEMGVKIATVYTAPTPGGVYGNDLRRKAMELATGDYIVWMGHDCLIDKDYLQAHADAILENGPAPLLSVVQGHYWATCDNPRRLAAYSAAVLHDVKEATLYRHVFPVKKQGDYAEAWIDLLNIAFPLSAAREMAFLPADDHVYAGDWLSFDRMRKSLPVYETPRILFGHF